MVGLSVSAQRAYGVSVILPVVLAAACALFGATTGGPGWWAATAILTSVAMVGLIVPSPPFHWRIDSDGLVDEITASRIPFDSISGVYPSRLAYWRKRPLRYALEVAHDGGYLRVPVRTTVATTYLEEFLLRQIPESTSVVDQDIERYRQAQVAAFGDERVFSFAGRRQMAKTRSRPAIWGFTTLLVGSLIAFGVGVWLKSESVIAVGVLGASCGLICLLFTVLSVPSQHLGRMAKSSLVISPLGLALSQEGLKGELGWSEILKITYSGKPRKFAVTASGMRPAIHVKLSGVTVMIYDSYDRPLSWIHERIEQYWK
ncbi:MAG TPA: hypothetical protein VGJ26_20945 [Pirellulales bacterium]|jgi:hypothetical protein